jgi:hypothetical protein
LRVTVSNCEYVAVVEGIAITSPDFHPVEFVVVAEVALDAISALSLFVL